MFKSGIYKRKLLTLLLKLYQVESELKETFTRLEMTAKEVTNDLTDEINHLEGIGIKNYDRL